VSDPATAAGKKWGGGREDPALAAASTDLRQPADMENVGKAYRAYRCLWKT